MTPNNQVKQAARDELEARYKMLALQDHVQEAHHQLRVAEEALADAQRTLLGANQRLTQAIEDQWKQENAPLRPPGVPLTPPNLTSQQVQDIGLAALDDE